MRPLGRAKIIFTGSVPRVACYCCLSFDCSGYTIFVIRYAIICFAVGVYFVKRQFMYALLIGNVDAAVEKI